MNKSTKKSEINIRPLVETLLTALMLALVTEFTNHRTPARFAHFVFGRPHLFFLNFTIIFMTLSFSLLFGKRRSVLILISSVWGVLGLTDFIMRFFRITPFAATDIGLLGSVWSVMFVYLKLWQVILIGIGIAAFITFLVFIFIKQKREKTDFRVAAVSISVSTAVLFGLLTLFLRTGILPHCFANLPDAYNDYGFAYSFSVGIFDRGIERPDNYSPENVNDILISIGASSMEKNRTKPNIIIVQLESFFDVNYLKNVTFSENPVKNFTDLKADYTNGFLTVPVIGSGTANTEFEVLTGMSRSYFGTAEYPYKTVLNDKTCETVAYNLAEEGYTCHALHNHSATFYGRNKVYANMGFDDFISVEYMRGTTENAIGWTRDDVLTSEVIKSLSATAGRDFAYVISVEAHGIYPSEPTEYVGKEGGQIEVFGIEDEGERNRYKYYVNALSETDRFIGSLISALDVRGEPTICVFFGDHLPNLDITDEDISNGNVYQTEYVMWSNMELSREVKDLYSYQLSAYVLGRAGFSNGIFTKLHQNYSQSENYYSALEMLEYDVLYGEGDAYGGTSKYKPTEIRMGHGDISATGMTFAGGILTVKGRNFTKYSSIEIGGKRIKTEFINSSTLRSAEGVFKDGDECPSGISVGQYTKNGEFLSSAELKKFTRK